MCSDTTNPAPSSPNHGPSTAAQNVEVKDDDTPLKLQPASKIANTRKRHVKPTPYICVFPSCDRQFARSYDLDRHMQTHFPGANIKYDCPQAKAGSFCRRVGDKGFTRKDHLIEHLRKVHLLDFPKTARGTRNLHFADVIRKTECPKDEAGGWRGRASDKGITSRDRLDEHSRKDHLDKNSSNLRPVDSWRIVNSSKSDVNLQPYSSEPAIENLGFERRKVSGDERSFLTSSGDPKSNDSNDDVDPLVEPDPVDDDYEQIGILPPLEQVHSSDRHTQDDATHSQAIDTAPIKDKDAIHGTEMERTSAVSLPTNAGTAPGEGRDLSNNIHLCDIIERSLGQKFDSQDSSCNADLRSFQLEMKTLHKFLDLFKRTQNTYSSSRSSEEQTHLGNVGFLLGSCHRTLQEILASLQRLSNDAKSNDWSFFTPSLANPRFFLNLYNRSLEISLIGTSLLHRGDSNQPTGLSWQDFAELSQSLYNDVRYRPRNRDNNCKDRVEEDLILFDVDCCINSARDFLPLVYDSPMNMSYKEDSASLESSRRGPLSESSVSNTDSTWDANDDITSTAASSVDLKQALAFQTVDHASASQKDSSKSENSYAQNPEARPHARQFALDDKDARSWAERLALAKNAKRLTSEWVRRQGLHERTRGDSHNIELSDSSEDSDPEIGNEVGFSSEVYSATLTALMSELQEKIENRIFEDAEVMCRTIIINSRRREKSLGIPFDNRAEMNMILAEIYLEQKRYQKTCKTLGHVLKHLDGLGPRNSARVHMLLARAHCGRNQLGSAGKSAQVSLMIREDLFGKEHELTRESALVLIQIIEGRGDDETAATLRTKYQFHE